MKKVLVIGLHATVWLFFLIMLFIVSAGATQGYRTGHSFSYIFQLNLGLAIIPSLVSFYTAYFLLFPKFGRKRKPLQLIGTGLLTAIGAGLCGALTLTILQGGDFLFQDGFNSFSGVLTLMSMIAFPMAAIGFGLRTFVSWFDELKVKEELKEKNHQMELALVKAQIDPHFLFNTIQNIDVLIEKDPETASNYLNRLSDILRFMLFETKTDRIDLTKELSYIHKYVDLQKIRSANPDFVKVSSAGNLEGAQIAPMIFIPFVENAFKHTTDKKLSPAIEIGLRREGNKVHFSCKNKIGQASGLHTDSPGLGNELIKRRLELLYPQAHSLRVSEVNGFYTVDLTLPLA